jgi:hypothetical protein
MENGKKYVIVKLIASYINSKQILSELRALFHGIFEQLREKEREVQHKMLISWKPQGIFRAGGIFQLS